MSVIQPFPLFEKPLRDDPGRSWTMPARYYTDPDVYEREMVDPARSGTAEHGVHQFHRLVTRALDDAIDR